MTVLTLSLVCGCAFFSLCMFVAGYEYHRKKNLSYIDKARIFDATFRKLAKKAPLDSLDVDLSSDNTSVSSRVATLTQSEFLCRTEFSLRPVDARGIKDLARHIFVKHLLDIYAQCRLRDNPERFLNGIRLPYDINYNAAAAKVVDYFSERE